MIINACRRLFSNAQNRKARRASFLPRLELLYLEERITPTTYTVTNTGDSTSSGSLRWAINSANANPGNDTINSA
jgi:hypothetical protein